MACLSGPEDRYERYLFEYRFQDAEWAFEIVAKSPHEAKERLRASNKTGSGAFGLA